MGEFLPPSPWDREQGRKRRARQQQRFDQARARAGEQAMAVCIDRDLYEAWQRFVKSSLATESDEYFDAVPDAWKKVETPFEDWREQIALLRDDNPQEFLEKVYFWQMPYAEYCELMDEIVSSTIHELGHLFEHGGEEGDTLE